MLLRSVTSKVEIHSVALIGFVYFIYLFFVKHNAYYVSCKFKTQYNSMFISLKEYVDNNLLTIDNCTKANGSFDDFLKDYTSNIKILTSHPLYLEFFLLLVF